MGRTIVYEPDVHSQLEKICQAKCEQTGLIVGQRTVQKDLIIYLCPTPTKEEEKEQITIEESPKKGKGSSGQKSDSSSSQCAIQLEEAWFSQYAKEVCRTLPGGFDILGIYIAAPTEIANKLQTKLRQILFSVFKILKKDQDLSLHSDINEKILLHICTVSFKCVCRTLDITDQKSIPNPADWKPLPSPTKWQTLQSQVAVDLKFAVKSDESGLSIKKHFDSGLSPLFQRICNSKAVINGSLKKAEDFLNPQLDSKKSKHRFEPHGLCYTIDLLVPLKSSDTNRHSQTTECSMMLTFKGTLECRAFVHSKATVLEALKAIQQDIIRTIRARCDIHCEDLLVIDEEQQDPVVVHELPRRAFAPLCCSTILVSDYQFHGDTARDSLKAFKELLNLELSEEDIQAYELSPVTSTLIQAEVNEDRLSEFGDTTSSPRNVLLPAAGAAVAALAAGISYILLWQQS